MKKIILLLITILMIPTLLAGCDINDDGKLKVYATIFPLYDLTQKIAGDKINLELVVPFGTEPHHYDPEAVFVARLSTADVFIYNGAGMELWVERVLQSINNTKLMIVRSIDGLTLLEHEGHDHHDEEEEDLHDEDEDHHEEDPHVWLDPLYAKEQMRNIKDALVEADPSFENKEYYEAQFVYWATKLDELHEEITLALEGITRPSFIVSHAAFGYFAHRYNLNQVSIEGIVPDTEPDMSRLIEVIEFANERGIKIIFYEVGSSDKLARTVAEGIEGGSIGVLDPMGTVTIQDYRNGRDYFYIMRENIEALLAALS